MLLQMVLFHFYGWVIFHCIYMHHIFIHSSASGRLGCFHVLAIANSAAMNIGVPVSLQIWVFSEYMPRNGTAGSYGNCLLTGFQPSKLVLPALSVCNHEWTPGVFIPSALMGGPRVTSFCSLIVPYSITIFHECHGYKIWKALASNLLSTLQPKWPLKENIIMFITVSGSSYCL